MIVRPAREADIPAIASVAAASYASGFAGILSPEELAVRNAASFAPLFVAALPLLRVAEVDGAIAGFSKVTAGHLDMLFIDPAAQRSGVGSVLLAEAEARGTCTLECFRDNRSARGFYERHGWTLARSYEREFLGRMRAFVFYEKLPASGSSGGETDQTR